MEQLVWQEKLQQFMDQTRERKTLEQAMLNTPNRIVGTHMRTQSQQHQANHVGYDNDDGGFPVVYAIFGEASLDTSL